MRAFQIHVHFDFRRLILCTCVQSCPEANPGLRALGTLKRNPHVPTHVFLNIQLVPNVTFSSKCNDQGERLTMSASG